MPRIENTEHSQSATAPLHAQPPSSVYLLTPEWPPETTTNGVCTYVSNIKRGMEALGVTPTILSMQQLDPAVRSSRVVDLADADQTKRSPLQRLKDATRSYFSESHAVANRTARRISHVVAKESDLSRVVVEIEESFGIARFLAKRQFKLVVRLHGPYFLAVPAFNLKRTVAVRDRLDSEMLAVQNADGIVAPTNYILSCAKKNWSIDNAQTRVIPNPVPEVEASSRWRPSGSSHRYVLYVGRFDRLKGADVALAAFSIVASRHPSLRMLFAGPDPGLLDESGRTWKLREYIAAKMPADVRRRIEYLGPVPKEELAKHRRAAAAAIVTSREESFSYVVAESLAMGCPVIASNAGGIPELITHNRSGLLFRNEDASDLAEKLETVLESSNLAMQLSRGAIEAAARWSPSAVAQQTLDFYRSLLASTSRCP